MGGFCGFHHIGTFFLFAGFLLLVVSSVTAPVVSSLYFLKVHSSTSSATFGAFGYCVTRGTGSATCSRDTLGYDVAAITSSITGLTYSSSALYDLTKGLILHPISASMAFLAFLIAAMSHRIGFLFSSLVALIALCFAITTLSIDFAVFTVIKAQVDSNAASSTATYGAGLWITVGAVVSLLLGTLTACCGCCTDRKRFTETV